MRLRYVSGIFAVLLVSLSGTAARAQQRLPGDPLATPRLDLSAGYRYTRANAPPGGCPCFGLNGGYLNAGFHLTEWFSVVGDFSVGGAKDISTLGQNLTLVTYMGGPRVSFEGRRVRPFAEGLFGGARANGSYFPTSGGASKSQSSFALSAGGGIDYNLTSRMAVRPVEVQFLRTSFTNGSTNQQNQMSISAGIVFKFGQFHHAAKVVPPPVVVAEKPAPPTLDLRCTVNGTTVHPGQMLDLVATATTNGNPENIRYSWSATGGTLEGAGNHVVVNTTDLAVGDYRVAGHAFFASGEGNPAECSTTFRVTPAPPPPAPQIVTVEAKSRDLDFHKNVQDIYFDYDKSVVRPDSQAALTQAANYLKNHADMHVLVGGYSDERGTADYNLSLGARRSNAARDALISLGIDGSRISVISYGKGAQVCTVGNENCWQQNRRAAFMLQP